VLQLTSQKARIEKQQILAVARNERRMELAKEKLERALLADKTAKQKAKAAKVKAKAKLTSKASSSAKAKPAKSTSKASSSPAPKRQASKRSVQAAKRTKVKE
jgi:septum formation inhibitor MinC